MIQIETREIPQNSTTTEPNKWEILVQVDSAAEKNWILRQIERGLKGNDDN